MPNIPFRGLGATGVISDVQPQDAPASAWTDARNIRFADGIVSRHSAFKFLDSAYSYSKQPVGVVDASAIGEEGFIVTVFSDGTMEQWHNGTTTSVTPVASLATAMDQITTCKLGQITYVNRETDAPIYRENPSDGVFQVIPGWNASDRCGSLRAFKDFLIAMDCTVSGVEYHTMVKWSNATQIGAPPADWDTTNPASLAGENVLSDLKSTIIDGLPLADSFMIYTDQEVVRMDYIGQPFIFNFNTLFNTDAGMIAKNCAVEVNGQHFVFGRNDIYVHDGVVKVSIVEGVIKDRVFSELDFDRRDRCFVYHDQFQSEVGFCYPSLDDTAEWRTEDIEGCNRAVVFNYVSKTWTIIDLPSVVASTQTASSKTDSWDTITTNFDTETANWRSYIEIERKNLLFTCTGNSAVSKPAFAYYFDPIIGGRLSNQIDYDVYWLAFAERVFEDFDGLGSALMSTTLLSRIVPQAKTFDTDQVINFQFGSSFQLGTDMSWGPKMSFNPWTDYKVDTRTSGRYIGLRIEMPAGVSGYVGGFDADVANVSLR